MYSLPLHSIRTWAVLLVALMPGAALAQPHLDHISPPVVERGKTARVTFVGRDLANAFDLWTSLPTGSLKAKPVERQPDRVVFEIEVSPQAPVGVLGVRLSTRDGLSNAHLFLIDDLPVTAKPSSDTTIPLPASIWGTFREADLDRFPIEVTAGQRVSFEVVASRFGKDADPLLTIRDAKNKWVAERDNDQGLYYDCRFEHEFKTAGIYTVELRDSRFRGSEHHQYVVRMGRFPAARVAIPSVLKSGTNPLTLPELGNATLSMEAPEVLAREPFFAALKRKGDDGSSWIPLTVTDRAITTANDTDPLRARGHFLSTALPTTLGFNWSPLRANPFLPLDMLLFQGKSQATPARVPGVLSGVIRKPGDRHGFALELTKGQSIFVRGEAKSLNSPLEIDLVLTDRFGRELRRGAESRDGVNLDFTANAPGLYGLFVRDQLRDGDDAFAYRVTVSDTPFPPVLIAEVEGLTIPQGSYQPIPILVTRTGSSGPINLKLTGAEGLKLTPDEIAENQTAVVCKLEATSATPLGVYSIQIRAETSTGPTLVRTQPLIDRQLINVDLIPHALREDQRRLPPSLADRLAVQVTPPSPFAMELPDALVTLPRYQNADIPIVTTRVPNFDAPIVFTAKGGQIADKSEGRTRVYAEFPEATAMTAQIKGKVQSKILSNLAKHRVEVTGTTTHDGRVVSLTRTFEMNLTTAFQVTSEPAKISLLPGESKKVKLLAQRLKSFDGAVTLTLNPFDGLSLPETVLIPKGSSEVEVEVTAAPNAMPRKQNLQLTASAEVSGYEEELRASFEVEILKVEVPTKKK